MISYAYKQHAASVLKTCRGAIFTSAPPIDPGSSKVTDRLH